MGIHCLAAFNLQTSSELDIRLAAALLLATGPVRTPPITPGGWEMKIINNKRIKKVPPEEHHHRKLENFNMF